MSGGSAPGAIELFLLGFVAVAVATLACALWAFWGRGHTQDWAFSLGFSTAATAPGLALLLELAVRSIAHEYSNAVTTWTLSTGTQWFCWLGSLIMGPVLFLSALLARAPRTPPTIYALQLLQLVAWAWAIPITLIFSISSQSSAP